MVQLRLQVSKTSVNSIARACKSWKASETLLRLQSTIAVAGGRTEAHALAARAIVSAGLAGAEDAGLRAVGVARTVVKAA